MPATAASQNLNGKLAAGSESSSPVAAVGIRWDVTPIHTSAPPVRIVGAASRYQGGYRVNV